MSGLARDELQVWWLHPQSVPAELEAHYRALLDPDERTMIDRLVFAHDRLLHLAAHALLRVALAAAGPLAAADWRFLRTGGGKPRLVPGQGGPGFNLTHTRDLAACALSWEGEVGIDAEHDRDGEAPFELGPTVFTARERAWLAGLAGPARAAGFFDLWTLKEAYMKARGLGLALSPLALEARVEPPAVVEAPQVGAWCFGRLRPTSAHHLAVVAAARPDLRRLRWRECVPLLRQGDGQQRPFTPPAG